MDCERCGAEGATRGQVLFFARLAPLLLFRPPLMERDLCTDCAGLANVIGIIFLGAATIVLVIVLFLLIL